MAKKGKQHGGKATARRESMALTADKFECYEESVQAPEVDAEFIKRTFKTLRKRSPRILREDFCGTAQLCADWVRLHEENRAYGIDLDEPTLNWGIETHLVPLGTAASRVELIRQDVRDPVDFKADVVAAFNFSYFIFKEREALRSYFKKVLDGLNDDGVLFLDIFGGPEAMDLREERTEYDDFTYVWDQDAFNPITNEITCHIHFEFPDGSEMNRAFTYKWRLWLVPEVREIAREAGFRETHVYWEGTDRKTGEGNGVYRISQKGDNAPAFVAYILCLK